MTTPDDFEDVIAAELPDELARLHHSLPASLPLERI